MHLPVWNTGAKPKGLQMSDIPSAATNQDLDALAAAVRREHLAAETALAARERVTRDWEQWVRRECQISLRSAQLSAYRLAGAVCWRRSSPALLSIAAALRILSGASTRNKSSRTKRALSPVIWLAASPEGRTQFLGEIGLPAVLAAMPASWSKIIEARVLGLRSKASSGDPDLRLSKIMRTALSHIAIASFLRPASQRPKAKNTRRFRPCVPSTQHCARSVTICMTSRSCS